MVSSKNGPSRRSGLSEDREEFQFAIDEHALDGNFHAGNIFFDQGFARGRRVFHLPDRGGPAGARGGGRLREILHDCWHA